MILVINFPDPYISFHDSDDDNVPELINKNLNKSNDPETQSMQSITLTDTQDLKKLAKSHFVTNNGYKPEDEPVGFNPNQEPVVLEYEEYEPQREPQTVPVAPRRTSVSDKEKSLT